MVKSRPCQICMRPIESERIENVPETRLCRDHAEEIKKYGGEFLVSTTMERTSKAGSLKRNYGGVNASKRRNTEGLDRLRDEYLDTRDRLS